jgi:acyl-CoA synthetase (AMP-forming)/AMP-acid ligase II
MFSRLILSDTRSSDQLAVVTPKESFKWRDLSGHAQLMLGTYEVLSRRRVGLAFRPTYQSYAALACMDSLGCDAFLFDPSLSLDEVLALGTKLHLGAVLVMGSGPSRTPFIVYDLPQEDKSSGCSTVTILTSGSTGEPKAARHTWQSLARPIRGGNSAAVWLLTYQPHLYAGLQVMLQCFSDAGTLAIPDHHADPASAVDFILQAGVNVISATPSYMRRLLMFADTKLLRRIPLSQITLGGEVVDQAILDRLRRLYPAARLVHIYATTELGRCFSVTDGLAGFPAHYLMVPRPDGVELKVEGGELWARSPNAMHTYDRYSVRESCMTDWFSTGDLVEVQETRVHFVGRKTDMINVAGSKVYPIEVERVIRTVPGVSDVRVFGKKSSIAGELVACEVVAEDGQDPIQLREAVGKSCRLRLTSYQQPRLITLVDQIRLSSAGKTIRSKS